MEKVKELYKEWGALQPVSEEVQTKIDRKFMLEFNYNVGINKYYNVL